MDQLRRFPLVVWTARFWKNIAAGKWLAWRALCSNGKAKLLMVVYRLADGDCK